MSGDVYVGDFSYALGACRHSVEESADAGRTRSGAAALRDAGFRYHHVSGDHQGPYDLARAAVAGIAERLEPLDAIIYATCIPANANVGSVDGFVASGDVKHLMDFPASRLQADFDLDRAMVLGLNQQACTSMLGSLRLAKALVATEADTSRVLCVTSDRFPPGALYEQAYNLVSDGAAACVVTREPGPYRLVAAHQITNGAMVHADDDETVGAYFNYTHRAVTEVLARAGLEPADLAWVVPQNTNAKAWAIMARLLGIDPARVFFDSMADVGHVISGDNVVNLARLHATGRVRAGDKVLLVMAGYGMNWQCTILEAT